MSNVGFQFLNRETTRRPAARLSQDLSQSGRYKSKEPYKYGLLWVIIVFLIQKQYII